jgi:uncharacterized protein
VVRFLALLVIAGLVYLTLRATITAFLAGLRGNPRPGRRASLDELVKDPVCGTYIPRRKAIARTGGTTTRYFCSAACADRYTPPS